LVTAMYWRIAASRDRVLAWAPLDLLLRQRREPAFDEVQPGRARRREGRMETGPPRQPPPNEHRLMGAVVVQDEMHVQVGGHLRIDGVEELPELDTAMAPMSWPMTVPVLASSAGRGSSRSPSSRRLRNRVRYLPTVCFVSRSSCATTVFVFPAAQPKMRRARWATAWGGLRPARPVLQRLPLGRRHGQWRNRSACSHRRSPSHIENAGRAQVVSRSSETGH
jgi:hypothetical protein